MKTFLSIKSIYCAAHLRLAAQFIGILLLTFLWPARGEAQTSSDPLNVSSLELNGVNEVILTCQSNGSWTYKDGNSSALDFNGTLTKTQPAGKVFLIKSEKTVTPGDTATYPKLILDNLNYTSSGAVFEMASDSKPVYIQTKGASKLVSTGLGTGDAVSVIYNDWTSLVIDGGSNGLEIEKDMISERKLYGIEVTSLHVDIMLQGKITVKVHNAGAGSSSAIIATSDATLSYGESANIQCTAQSGIFTTEKNISSPFLEWTFAGIPAGNKTLEIRDANGTPFDPAITFTTNAKAKSFTISAKANTGYTLWLDGKKQMDSNRKTVFTATDDNLFSFSGIKEYTPPSNWNEYAQTANVGPVGTDVTASDNTHYTVHTPAGLAWIAWVTGNGKKSTDGQNYPTNKGFAGCTVTLDSDISLTKPEYGVTDNFYAGWPTIGYGYSSDTRFKGIFDGGNHTISDLSMTGGVADYTGLFSYIEEAVIKNLRVVGKIEVESTSNGNIRLGGIAGFASNSKIIACSNAVKITLTAPGVAGNESNIGGIVGQASSSDIRNCWNEASLSGTSENLKFNIGGIAGRSNSPIYNCYSSGDVSGTGNSSSACKSGGIVGYMEGSSTLSNCYATGSVSATNNHLSSAACAGGIVGDLDSATVSNCLALNAGDKISAKGGANGSSNKGRIVGYKGQGTISNNYASTKIMLSDGYSFTAPTENIGADAINGENIYIDDAADIIAAWTGDGTAFTAIGTDPDGKLPQLKVIASLGWDGLPSTYENSVMDHQHQPSLTTSGYLGMPTALELPASSPTITLSFSDGKWSYQKEGGAPTRFTGTVKMAEGVNKAEIALVVSTTTGNPTLTFENVYLNSTYADLLTINNGCVLTLHAPDKPLHLTSGDSYGLINRGTLSVTGKGLSIEKANPTNYGFDNYGIFMVPDLAETSVIIFGNGQTMKNSGTLDNAWIEWQFESYPGKIAFAATDDTNQSPDAQACKRYKFATPVTPGKTYRLWKVTDDSPGEVRTRQEGKKDDKTVSLFPAPAEGEVAVYKTVEDVKTITIANAQNFSAATCSERNVIVNADGVLTVDADSATVVNLTLEKGGQVVTTKPLKVDETISTTRTLDNQWIAFGSPVAMTASVKDTIGQLLYLGTGYTDSDPLNQCWKNVTGFSDTGEKTADLAADSPYLLAAEEPSTKVTLAAFASAGQPVEIPETATVTLGAALKNGQFLFRTNPNMSNLTLSNIYVLNAEGTYFIRQTGNYELKPFEAYVVANAVTCSRISSLKIGKGIATGIEQPLAADTRIWGTPGTLHISADAPADVVIVTPAGRTLRTFKAPVGDTTLTLPAGIYFVRCNDITYKVSL